jgi:aminoglycoside phosphotransferase (APT) family kinase protein
MTPQPWTAERVVDESLAGELIGAQFPELGSLRLAWLGAGWDNTAWLVNDAWIFRFPRRQLAVEWLKTEAEVLPQIAPRVPLPIPVPRWNGQPTTSYPWPFVGYAYLPGRTACTAKLDIAGRMRLARPLAHFLRTLHSLDSKAWQLPGDKLRRLDLDLRIPRARSGLERLVTAGLISDPAPWLAIVDNAPIGYLPDTTTLVHGDLYARHVLVDDRGSAAGVIDWGDVHRGDAASDLAIAWAFLPRECRDEFRNEYGPIDDAPWQLARFSALQVSAIILAYGHETGDEALVQEGRLALEHLLSD